MVEMHDMVATAVNQMQDSATDSGLFDHKFLCNWELKPEHEKTWVIMKMYYTNEYDAIKNYSGLTAKSFEPINNIQKKRSQEITEFFDDLRRDAIVGREQIQQMSEAFTGASSALKETMNRLKETTARIVTLNKTAATLTKTNKQLTESNKQLADALKMLGGKKVHAMTGEM
jgi:hypothetical protein